LAVATAIAAVLLGSGGAVLLLGPEDAEDAEETEIRCAA